MTTAIIEMPKGTRYKYEISKETGQMTLDRPVKEAIPHNYGYIPNTLCDDGDPIDVFVAALEPIPPLIQVQIEIVGIIDCIDDGKHDPKLLAYIKGDDLVRNLVSFERFAQECILYLKGYKEGLVINGSMFGEVASHVLALSRVKASEPKA